jgi:hypothetical protein
MSFQAWALRSRASCRASTAGRSVRATPSAAATFMAVGNVSFDDCDMLAWSFGWTGFLLPRG